MRDLVVVGAGMVGTLAAYLAARARPEWRILLVDRSLVAHGTTLYSGGLDHPYGWSDAQKVLAVESARIFRAMRDEIPGLPFYDLPLFGVVSRESLPGVMSRFTREGVRDATAAEAEALRRTYPGLGWGSHQVLITGCEGGYGVPAGVAQAAVERFRAAPGAECWEGVEIRNVERAPEGYVLRTTDGRSVATRRVLAATGPWMPEGIGREAARAAGVRIKKIVALHVDRRPEPRSPIVFFFDDDSYLLPLVHRGHWVFSFPSREWDCLPEVSRLAVSPDDRALARSILERYAPALVEDCHGARVFCDAYTADRLPLLAALPGEPGFVAAGGCSGFGFRLAPAIARRALELLPGFGAAETEAGGEPPVSLARQSSPLSRTTS